jgi:hypothetical protein
MNGLLFLRIKKGPILRTFLSQFLVDILMLVQEIREYKDSPFIHCKKQTFLSLFSIPIQNVYSPIPLYFRLISRSIC